ncbi:MAG: CUAEP/CCAEP-tail radical SAM protein [Pseudomonadota bacterium]
MYISLINPYELGRQPFGLAEPAAFLQAAGHTVRCCDLSIQKLDTCLDETTGIVAIYIAMHTATRIAVEALPKIRQLAPHASLCVYGLYAPMNANLFRSLGVDTILGGEFETGLVSMAQRVQTGRGEAQTEPETALEKITFIAPDRSKLPPLSQYARLINPDGSEKTVGFAETTRGCKYLCRHCPVVPVYQGKFYVVPANIVLDDIRTQINAGARHISFGDPDFLNGPGHAIKIVQALHREYPDITYDATIKIEHIINYPEEIKILKQTGCLFILAAVEAVDDTILELLDKGHSRADFINALAFLREIGINLAPTFVAFTPWTTLDNYLELLEYIQKLQLIEATAPVQLSIRLLIPAGSYILKLDGLDDIAGEFDAAILGHPWSNPDPRVDELQQKIQSRVTAAESEGLSRPEIFQEIWRLAHEQAGKSPPEMDIAQAGKPVPRLSENWYCCAEPTCEQLVSF